MTVCEQVREIISKGLEVEVCRIIKAEGSSPRKVGAVMFHCSDGSIGGTIGGGNLEMYCHNLASQYVVSHTNRVHDFKLDGSQGAEFAMACGGFVSVRFTWLCGQSSEDDFTLAFGREETSPLVWIFGTGHVGSEVGPLLAHVGFRVAMVDDRPDFADPSLFPFAEKTVLCDYSDIGASVDVRPEDYVVIMTHGHIGDRDVLLHACRINPAYVGCIGSRRKIAMVQAFLRENGISEEVISSIHAPIGIEIYGDTPAEIAVSVTAEIIRHRAVLNGPSAKKCINRL